MGPTAVGKTKLSVELALDNEGEILSADSMQIYRGMDIGTAKANLEERCGIAHWGLDLVDPEHPYTVAEFQQYAKAVIEEIRNRNHFPIIVGGTGLYVKSLIDPLDFTPAGENSSYREQLYARGRSTSSKELHEELQKCDPLSAERIHPNDLKRIVRALEVFYETGTPMSDSYLPESQQSTVLQDFAMIGLTMSNRELLYEAINRRVDQMVDEGLIREVEQLWKKGLAKRATSMQAIGYKEITAFLQGEVTLAEAIAAVRQNSRRLAKRQLSWFRRDPRIHWIETDVHPWEKVVRISKSIMEGISAESLE